MDAYRKLNLAFRKISRAATRYPRAVCLSVLATAVFFGAQLPHIKVVVTPEQLVDRKFRTARELTELNEAFDVSPSAYAFFSPPKLDVKSGCEFRNWLARDAVFYNDVTQLFTSFDLRRAEWKPGDYLFFPRLLKIDCDYGKPEEPLSLAGIEGSPWRGVMADAKGSDLLAEFRIDPSAPPTRTKEIMKAAPLPLVWSGTAVYSYFMFEGIQVQQLLNLAVLILILVSFRIFFGSWVGGWLYILSLVFTGIILHGMMAFFGAPLDVLSNSIFMMVAVAALEDFVFIGHEQLERGTSWRGCLSRLTLPGFLTSFTTTVGFASLCVSDLAVIRRFGVWAAVASLLEWAMIFILLPALLRLWKRGRVWANPARARWNGVFDVLGRWTPSLRLSRALLVLVFVPALFCWKFLNVTDAPIAVFPASHPFRKAVNYVKDTRGWEADVSLVFQDKDKRDFNRKVIALARAHPNVAVIEDPYELEDYLHGGRTGSDAAMIDRVLTSTPVYKRLMSDETGRSRAILYVRDSRLEAINKMRAELEANCPNEECFAAGTLIAYAEFADRVPRTLMESLFVSILLVGSILSALAASVGRLKLLPAVLMSSFWGPCLMLGMLVVFQVQVNFLTCIFASVLVGLTGDNAIQYLSASGRRGLGDGIERRQGGSIQCALAMAGAALLFLFSYFYPPKIFGILLAGGMLAALAGDLWLLKGMIAAKAESGK